MNLLSVLTVPEEMGQFLPKVTFCHCREEDEGFMKIAVSLPPLYGRVVCGECAE